MNYADIPALDFSQFDVPGGKEKLTAQMKQAVEDTGMPLYAADLPSWFSSSNDLQVSST